MKEIIITEYHFYILFILLALVWITVITNKNFKLKCKNRKLEYENKILKDDKNEIQCEIKELHSEYLKLKNYAHTRIILTRCASKKYGKLWHADVLLRPKGMSNPTRQKTYNLIFIDEYLDYFLSAFYNLAENDNRVNISFNFDSKIDIAHKTLYDRYFKDNPLEVSFDIEKALEKYFNEQMYDGYKFKVILDEYSNYYFEDNNEPFKTDLITRKVVDYPVTTNNKKED